MSGSELSRYDYLCLHPEECGHECGCGFGGLGGNLGYAYQEGLAVCPACFGRFDFSEFGAVRPSPAVGDVGDVLTEGKDDGVI